MTFVRIVALALLLGAAVSGVVWFAWGLAAGFVRNRSTVSTNTKGDETQAPKKETGRAA